MMRTALIAMDKIDMAREAMASIRVRLHSFCSASFLAAQSLVGVLLRCPALPVHLLGY